MIVSSSGFFGLIDVRSSIRTVSVFLIFCRATSSVIAWTDFKTSMFIRTCIRIAS
jgi:hypothetical protein